MLVLLATVGLNVYLYVIVPKGFFPQQDTGRSIGRIQRRPEHLVPGDAAEARRVHRDRARGPGGGERRRLHRRRPAQHRASMFVTLKPLAERERDAPSRSCAAARASSRRSRVPNLFLSPVQDIRVGGRQSNAQYQYTLQADDLAELRDWEPRIRAGAARRCPSSPTSTPTSRTRALQTIARRSTATPRRAWRDHAADRHHAERRVRPAPGLDDLHAAQPVPRGDGSRAANSGKRPDALDRCYVSVAGRRAGAARRCSRATSRPTTPLAVNHQGQFVASTISFNLPPGVSLSRRRGRSTMRSPASACRRRSTAASGHRARLPGSRSKPAVPDPRRAARGLHRARHALRELRPPAHHPVDAAVGGRRRARWR